MELHERIAFVRKAAGLTQEQLGEKLGVTRQAVSKWESAQATPDALTVARLCTELGVSADFVLLGKEPDGTAASAPPVTVACPCCGKLTPAGTLKCQGCGYDYYPTPPDDEHRYAVILREGSYDSDFLPKMALFSGWEPEQCRQANAMMQTYGEAHREFVLLRRSLSRSAAMHIAANLSRHCGVKIVSDDPLPGYADAFADAEQLELAPEALPCPAPAKSEKEQHSGIGFWGIVGAVLLAIVIASFL